ncbi:MAG TPA: 30S ribosomal protein S1 [Terracidiphilus sp.]|jgi:small subunit ribosomal protein S1|nr:30S ribosomal protein S1 [Terracidiphilus sp.]
MTDENVVPSLPSSEPTPEPVAEAKTQPENPVQPALAQQPKPVIEAPAEVVPGDDEPTENFADLLRDFERSHTHKPESGAKQLEGTVVSLSADQVFVDIGYKTEGVLPRSIFENNADTVKPGDTVMVSVKGRNEEGYYELSRFKVAQPRDWTALESAFNERTPVVGTVSAVVKGGVSVDVGVRAFMPASRSGTKDAAELEKLVGTEITCRITKLDITDENVVVDRRVVLEEQARAVMAERHAAMKEGDTLTGTVRTLMPYGAFIDLGGTDGLLHISDMAYSRVAKPEDMLTVGQELTVRVLKIDPDTKKISLGLKQLQAEPWETAPQRLVPGQRVSGIVTRIMDFGAFVEIEPGVEGLIHISEMSWGKKIRHPSDVVKPGDRVDAVILSVKPEERRIALGLKQTLADPWLEVQQKFPAGSQIEGPVTKLMAFGAFVQIAEGIEGLVHISEIVADRRLNHPSDALRVGQIVQAQVLAIDAEKRQIKLSMKQLIPTSIDEYVAERKVGDTVSGRVVDVSSASATVEVGEGIRATCRISAPAAASASGSSTEAKPAGKADLSSLTNMLQARWKGNTSAASSQPEPLAEGQIRTFKIKKLDPEAKKIEVELA